MTALTAFLTATAATTTGLTTTAKELLTATPAVTSQVATTIAKSTGYIELRSVTATSGLTAGTPTMTQGATTAVPVASGNGWVWDATTLEGQQLSTGTYSVSIRVTASATTTISSAFYVRVFKRSSAGVYTNIGMATIATAQVATTAGTLVTKTGSFTTSSATSFATGDNLYIDVIAGVTANTAGSNSSTITLARGTSADDVATPGYVALNPPTSLTATAASSSIDLSWTAPASGAAPTAYNIYRTPTNPNLLTGDDSSFGSGLGAWTSEAGGAVSWTGSALRATAAGTAGTYAGSGYIAVSPSTSYVMTASVRNQTGTATLAFALENFTSALGLLPVSTGTATTPSGTFATKSQTFTTNSSAAFVKLRALSGTGTIGDAYDLDDVTFALTPVTTLLDSTTAPTTTYSDTSAASGATYTYTVRSVFTNVESADSNSVSQTASDPPNAPIVMSPMQRRFAVARSAFY